MILYSKHRKLKKGTGFNLDLLIAGEHQHTLFYLYLNKMKAFFLFFKALLMNLNSLFGLPW
jgi:hypothetical protein